jgi:mono/diheme cytochrome c family protein
MIPMNPRMNSALAVAATLIVCASLTQGQQARPSAKPLPTHAAGDVARGKYIVEQVAMCGQCHTPRLANGHLDQSRALQGASVFMVPMGNDPNWPLVAPRIGGNPPASDADMIKLLTTGIWTNGRPLRFPMMPFRMSEADAAAVVAYLKSLTPGTE